ncbi:MAG: pentapeptide repeat-containing protein [Desulfurivibrionaceae bacterium]
MTNSIRKTPAAALLLCSLCLAFSPPKAVASTAKDLEPKQPAPVSTKPDTPLPLPSKTTAEIERLIGKNGCPGCNLTGADLAGLNLNRANLTGANLSGANLAGSSLKAADLAEANLHQANLTGANLAGADLFKADLTGANMSGTDLEGAYLSGTILEKEGQQGSKKDIEDFLTWYRNKTKTANQEGNNSLEKERPQTP